MLERTANQITTRVYDYDIEPVSDDDDDVNNSNSTNPHHPPDQNMEIDQEEKEKEEEEEAPKPKEYCFCKALKFYPEESLICQTCNFPIHIRCSGSREFLKAYFDQVPYPAKKFTCFICRNNQQLIKLYREDILASSRAKLIESKESQISTEIIQQPSLNLNSNKISDDNNNNIETCKTKNQQISVLAAHELTLVDENVMPLCCSDKEKISEEITINSTTTTTSISNTQVELEEAKSPSCAEEKTTTKVGAKRVTFSEENTVWEIPAIERDEQQVCESELNSEKTISTNESTTTTETVEMTTTTTTVTNEDMKKTSEKIVVEPLSPLPSSLSNSSSNVVSQVVDVVMKNNNNNNNNKNDEMKENHQQSARNRHKFAIKLFQMMRTRIQADSSLPQQLNDVALYDVCFTIVLEMARKSGDSTRDLWNIILTSVQDSKSKCLLRKLLSQEMKPAELARMRPKELSALIAAEHKNTNNNNNNNNKIFLHHNHHHLVSSSNTNTAAITAII